MKSKEIRAIRKQLGLTAAEFAVLLGVKNTRTVRRWESGEQDIPGPAEMALVLLMELEDADQADFVKEWLADQYAKLDEEELAIFRQDDIEF